MTLNRGRSTAVRSGERISPERMSDRSISSDWTPMLLLKAFLQEEPLTSRSKSTGSKGELYSPYLQEIKTNTKKTVSEIKIYTG